MLPVCATCIHAGRTIGYRGYRKGGSNQAILWCEKYQAKVPQDYVCLAWEDGKGHTLGPGKR